MQQLIQRLDKPNIVVVERFRHFYRTWEKTDPGQYLGQLKERLEVQ